MPAGFMTAEQWNTRHNPAESAELQRHREGEEWCASMFAKIMAVGISGIADAAVVGRGPFTAEHTLRTVEMLRDRARSLESALNAAREAIEIGKGYLERIILDMGLSGERMHGTKMQTDFNRIEAVLAQIDKALSPQQSKTT